ncbi:AAA family ATPase [Phenylobacterium deserti]|uniref:Gluconate kinase n=1 Tax=Phenylobacterium deserti TaxID=1914756 RepID=A0A328ATM1_9CAUL|nr:bifunctional aminoglycoside phosphotransferase/ATP-binding protein [Phenylobacterium deserti]RAK57909.1 gluconate kinase [Phenylobacterium deserti]
MSQTIEAEVTAWFAARSERTVETALARVFLDGGTAWKVKRTVDLGYVDFTTQEKRLWALERELEFNRKAAPDIYRRIHPITRASDGGLELNGSGETVEFALEMRRFDDAAVLAARPERLDGDMAEALGRTIADFHAGAPVRPDRGVASLDFTLGSNARLLREMSDRLGAEDVETLVTLTTAERERQDALLIERSRTGYSRQCHGDLHLGNILVEGDRPILFDCIEFNDLLSDVDVLSDLGFILMDLEFRGRRDTAVRVLSGYLDQAARSFPETLWGGLAILPLMLSVRAAVRAHVSAHSGDDALSRRYIQAGIAHLQAPPPVLAAVGGFSGSGKSSFARQVAPRLGASPGAVILRTDEVRKRLAGVAPADRLPPEAYAPEAQARAYDAMFDDARRLLEAGRAVVLDATFMDPVLRDRAQALAKAVGAPFHGAWLQAPADVLRERVRGRTGDASDADVAVLEAQLHRDLGPLGWRTAQADQPCAISAAEWLAAEEI